MTDASARRQQIRWAPTTAGRLSYLSFALSERRLLLILLDLVALNGALVLSLWLHPVRPFRVGRPFDNPVWFVLLSLVWLLIAQAFDVYDVSKLRRLSTAVSAVLKAGGLTLVVYLFIPYLTPMLPAYRRSLFAFLLVPMAVLAAIRGLYWLVLARPFFHRRTLIVGAGWAGETIARALNECGDRTYDVVGYIDDDPAKQNLTLGASGSNRPVLGTRHSLPELIATQHITTLILAITNEVDGELLQILMECLGHGVEIVPMPLLYEELTGRVPVEHVGGNWSVAMPIHHPGTGGLNRLTKRFSDIVFALVGLLFLLPMFPLIALAIYLDSPGPLLYTQERVGQGGGLFKAYKFRSMIPDAERGQAVWAKRNDPRVTRVGRLLRKTHVDEFPQFFNILKGEMSAVGPRPERPEFVEELAAEIPFYKVRHAVKPGMAGWGLVRQGYGASRDDALLKLQYDLYYIKHQSLWLDLVILLKTVVDAITLGGR